MADLCFQVGWEIDRKIRESFRIVNKKNYINGAECESAKDLIVYYNSQECFVNSEIYYRKIFFCNIWLSIRTLSNDSVIFISV